MKIDIKITHANVFIIAATLQAVYNTKALTRRNKSTLSMALEVTSKFDSKASSLKPQATLFDEKKKVKITLKYHEADILEILLLQQIKSVEDPYILQQIQSTINQLNQKLA